MTNLDNPDGRPGNDPQPQGHVRVTIAIPYSLSNMVFVEAAPFWLCLILGIVGVATGGLGLLTGEQTYGIVIGSGVSALIGLVGLLVFWCALWRRALQGYFGAINVLYASYLLGLVGGPLIVPMAAFAFPVHLIRFADRGWLLVALAGLVVLVVLGLIWLVALMNVFDRQLWEFARLDGLCPLCRQWRFGRVKRPTTVTCAHCGGVLEFVRVDEQQEPSAS